MTIGEFLGRFEKVKRSGGQAFVSCPAHGPEHTPSLAVKEGSNGTILLTCHAHCSVESILSAMSLEASDLFSDSPRTTVPRTITQTYQYRDEQGTVLFECVRFAPKGFSQRRPDGAGGWIYDLHGVRRVLYRLPELLGQAAILICEGERDVDAAWQMGLPATTNPMGAGKWDQSYAEQLTAAGVRRAAVIPDNDTVGQQHANAVTASLLRAGIEVRRVLLPGVPDHGDLSDYIAAGHGKDDLVVLVRHAAVAEAQTVLAVQAEPTRTFKQLGWRGYQVTDRGFTLEIEKLRDDSRGTHGLLICRVNGLFPGAKTHSGGVCCQGEFNCRSPTTRKQWAKLIQERTGSTEIDWFGVIEEFVAEVLEAERTGPPMQLLSDFPAPESDLTRVIVIDGIPILRDHPLIIFGDGGSCKSYLALYFAGRLVQDHGLRVGYVDWELSGIDHRDRLEHLFGVLPRIPYVRYHRPLVDIVDDLERKVREWDVNYLVLDSVGYGTKGAPESAEAAMDYFRAVNQLAVGTLQLAHVVKQKDDAAVSKTFKHLRPFGSTFWHNSARATWYIHRASDHDGPNVRIGLYHQKYNTTGEYPSVGLDMSIGASRVIVRQVAVEDTRELADGLTLRQRVLTALREGPKTGKELAADLGAKPNSIRQAIKRSTQIRLGDHDRYYLEPRTEDGTLEF